MYNANNLCYFVIFLDIIYIILFLSKKEEHTMEMNIDYTALGKRIRNTRQTKKMTQEQLAEMCALSAAHIGHIERGTRIPSLDTVFRIAQALDVSLDYLIFDSLGNDESSLASLHQILDNLNGQKRETIISAIKALSDYSQNH